MLEKDESFDFRPREISLRSLYNTSDMGVIIKKYNKDFDCLWDDRAFIDSYISQGWEEDELIQFRENTASLELDYQECSTDTEEQNDV